MRRSIFGLTCILFLCALPAQAENEVPLTRSSMSRYGGVNALQSDLLRVRRMELALAGAQMRQQRARDLLEKELIAEREYEEIDLEYQGARIEYEDALLRALGDHAHVLIRKAVKKRSGQGTMVELELQYVAPRFPKELNPSPQLESLLRAPLSNIFVSLESEGIVVGDPYEAQVDHLAADERVTLEVRLLRDCDELVVRLRYDGRVESRPIILLRDATDDQVAVSCPQFSQEADLGATAEYSLSLERYSTDGGSVALRVDALPPEIGRTFIDPSTGARINEATFPRGGVLREVVLRLYLPERPSEGVPIDVPIAFRVVAERSSGSEMGPNTADLLLLPRGVPKLEMSAPNLFLEIARDTQAQADLVLTNAGSKRLDGIHVDIQPPMGWESTVAPPTISQLDPGERKTLKVTLTPPDDAPGGEYEVKLQASTRSDSRLIETGPKVLRVRLAERTIVFGSLVLAATFLLLVGGVVGLGVRVSRR